MSSVSGAVQTERLPPGCVLLPIGTGSEKEGLRQTSQPLFLFNSEGGHGEKLAAVLDAGARRAGKSGQFVYRSSGISVALRWKLWYHMLCIDM